MAYAYLAHPSPIGGKDDLSLTFIVRDVQDASQAIQVAIGEAPLTYLGRVREAIPSHRPSGYDTFEVTFEYVDPSVEGVGQPPAPPDDQTPSLPVLEIDATGGGTQHITTAIAQRRAPPDAPAMRRVIGASINTGGGWTVEGVDIDVREFAFSVTIQWPVQALANAGGGQYLFSLYRNRHKVNSSPWTLTAYFRTAVLELPFEAGEVRFMGYRGGGNGEHFPITYMFLASENRKITIDEDIEPLDKRGHEYLWVMYKPVEDPKAIIQRPFAGYVATVYEETDFGFLGF